MTWVRSATETRLVDTKWGKSTGRTGGATKQLQCVTVSWQVSKLELLGTRIYQQWSQNVLIYTTIPTEDFKSDQSLVNSRFSHTFWWDRNSDVATPRLVPRPPPFCAHVKFTDLRTQINTLLPPSLPSSHMTPCDWYHTLHEVNIVEGSITQWVHTCSGGSSTG